MLKRPVEALGGRHGVADRHFRFARSQISRRRPGGLGRGRRQARRGDPGAFGCLVVP